MCFGKISLAAVQMKKKKRQAVTDTTDHLENCGVVSEKDDGRLTNTGLWRWRGIYGFEKFLPCVTMVLAFY